MHLLNESLSKWHSFRINSATYLSSPHKMVFYEIRSIFIFIFYEQINENLLAVIDWIFQFLAELTKNIRNWFPKINSIATLKSPLLNCNFFYLCLVINVHFAPRILYCMTEIMQKWNEKFMRYDSLEIKISYYSSFSLRFPMISGSISLEIYTSLMMFRGKILFFSSWIILSIFQYFINIFSVKIVRMISESSLNYSISYNLSSQKIIKYKTKIYSLYSNFGM
jgi:hypothetical protein